MQTVCSCVSLSAGLRIMFRTCVRLTFSRKRKGIFVFHFIEKIELLEAP
jgi:hypothetical protein